MPHPPPGGIDELPARPTRPIGRLFPPPPLPPPPPPPPPPDGRVPCTLPHRLPDAVLPPLVKACGCEQIEIEKVHGRW